MLLSDRRELVHEQPGLIVESETTNFHFMVFRGTKNNGNVQELIVVHLPRAMAAGKELYQLMKDVQQEITGSKTNQWEMVTTLGAFSNACWMGSVALQHLSKPNVFEIAKGALS
jgi:hypothetical protein